MQTVGYLEAWQVWFSGQQPPPDAVLWFMSIRWWSRAGKVAAFAGGATVILDLIGPERLRSWGSRTVQATGVMSTIADFAGVLIMLAVTVFASVIVLVLVENDAPLMPSAVMVVIITVFMVLFCLRLYKSLDSESLSSALTSGIVRLLDRERPAQIIRYVAVCLLAVGFHFDLLSS